MTALLPPPASLAAGPVRRDRAIDLVRAGSLALVVALHALMVGVTVAGGEPVFANALEVPGFAPFSWFVQMMPLFFIAGGVTAIGSWRRSRERGGTPGTFIAARTARLMRPAAALFLVVACALGMLAAAGVPGDLVAEAGFRISQPLWFLGAFLLVQALVPLMAVWHERARVSALLLPLAGVAAVDLIRFGSGIEAIGFLNLALVWLFVQQLGFWHADGDLIRMSGRTRTALLLAVGGALAVLCAAGPYAADMYVNLNPPTLLLALFGAAQALLLGWATPWLRRAASRPAVDRAIDVIAPRAMTVYLWHMPVLIGLAGLAAAGALAGAVPLPDPLSVGWWLTRPAWLAVAAVSVALVTAAAHRFERGRPGSDPVSLAAACGAAALGVATVACMFVAGLGPGTALCCAALCAVAAALAGDFPTAKARAGAIALRRAAREAGGVVENRGARA